MAHTSKIEFLDDFNSLLKLAKKGDDYFPDELCNFLVSDFGFQAMVLFAVINSKNLKVLGKSTSARKNYLRGSEFTCSTCKLFENPNDFAISIDSNCELQISEFVIYESCLAFNISLSERGFLKIAKKTPFSQADTESLRKITDYISSLLSIWWETKGTGSSYSDRSFVDIVLDVTNELRSNANSILGSTSILSEDNLSVSQTDYVSALKTNAQNLVINLKDFINIAKLETTASDYSKNINLNDLVSQVIESVKTKFASNKITYSVTIDNNIPPECNLDDIKLKYILTNLLSFNSSLTQNEEIILKINMLSTNKLQFIISDNSKGIEQKLSKSIFEPFVVNKIKDLSKSGLSGLSLTLVKNYIKLLEGEINVKSNISKGTSFNFSIHADMHKDIEPVLSQLPKPSKLNNILVIEDDYATSKLLSNYLNKWGYSPTIVNTEEQTFSQLDKEKYLAIILDIELPNINGLELLKKIHDHRNAKNIPVIVCSIEVEEQKAFLMGAVEYFVKPINYNYLVEVLTSYKLRKNSNILCVDDDMPTLNLIKQAIETAGFNAIAENVSANVMESIKDRLIDLAIVDLDMPHPNGYELIRLIKSDPQFAKLPIIIYTGKENYEEDLKNIDGLFEELLDKRSVNIEDLSETISSMINRYEIPTTVEEAFKKPADEVKILFAEDYKHSQIIVTRLLKKNGFENVVVVENGEEALNLAKKEKFNLILMDMQMPIMNGFEATEQIKKLPGYKDTTIIALTAFAMKGDREKCLDAGATDYIPKPIDSKEFIEKVKYYLNASK